MKYKLLLLTIGTLIHSCMYFVLVGWWLVPWWACVVLAAVTTAGLHRKEFVA